MSVTDLYELGQPRPDNGWLVSDWDHFSRLNRWSADNVRVNSNDQVELTLNQAPAGSPKPYHGGEIQSDAAITSGTFSWVAKAPRMVSGSVFGMFTFQQDHTEPRCEFDFEFVGSNTRRVWLVVHMEGPDGQRVTNGGRFYDLGFDAAEGFHRYETVVTAHDEVAFKVDGKVLAYFSDADMPNQVWETRPMNSYSNLWAYDSPWAGGWHGLDDPLVATLRSADVQGGVYNGIFEMNGNSAGNQLSGTARNEIIRGHGGNDKLFGAAGTDFLRGGAGNDWLDGGAGLDRLEGGLGNDTYIMAELGDTLIELAGGGRDRVIAAVSLRLQAEFEDLVLAGKADLRGIGNSAANSLSGNSGANILMGLGGADTLRGAGGNDTLLGGNGNDILIGHQGHDRLRGEAGSDRLIGGAGNDKLAGGAGQDRLVGGLGDDHFVFNSLADVRDRIFDFHNVTGDDDRIYVDALAFGGGLVPGTRLDKSLFQTANDAILSGPAEKDIRFIFEKDATKLWFDSNGSDPKGLVLVADLQAGATVTYADIFML